MVVTRGRLAELARDAGMKVTERTLRYWAHRGLIPHPSIVGGRAHYPESLLGDLQVIESLRRKPIEEVKAIVRSEVSQSLFHYRVRRENGSVIIEVRPKGKGNVA